MRLRGIWTTFRRSCAYEEYEQRLGGVALTRNMDSVWEGLRLRETWTAFRRSCANEKYGHADGPTLHMLNYVASTAVVYDLT